MRRLARLLPYLALLALLVIALLALLRSGPLARQVRAAVLAELERQTGREVSVGQVSVGLTGTITLRDLQIRDKEGRPLLRCPAATVAIAGKGELLRGNLAGLRVESITLDEPELRVVRDSSGRLNVADLGRPRPGKKPFHGTIRVENGRVTLADEARGGVTTALESVSGRLRQQESGAVQFRVEAEGAEGAFGSLKVAGSRDGEGRVKVSGSVRDLDLAYAMERLPEVKALSVAAGRGQVKAEMTLDAAAPPDERLGYRVEVEAAGAEVSFPWLRRPVKGVEGKGRLVNGDLELDGVKGTVAEAPVEVSGTISDLPRAELALDISASGIRVKQVQELLPNIYVPAALLLPAPVRIQARAEGPASEVVVSGKAETRVIKFRMVPWNEVVARFRYSQGRLEITGLSAHGSPRRVEGDVTVDWGKGRPEAEARLRLSRVPADLLSQMLGLPTSPVAGLASLEGELALAGRSQEVKGTVTLDQATWAGLPLGRAGGSFRYRDGVLELQDGWFSGPSGKGSFSGNVRTRPAPGKPSRAGPTYELRLTAEGVPIGVVAKAFGWPTLQGLPLGWASGRAQISDQRILLEELRFVGGGFQAEGHLQLRDWRAGDKRGALSGEFNLAPSPLSQCLPYGWGRYAGDVLAAGQITVGGTRAMPTANADIALKLPAVGGLMLDVGHAHVRYEGGAAYVEDAEVADGRSRVELTGSYRPQSGLDLELRADPLSVGGLTGDLRRQWGLVVEGTAHGSARLTGSLRDPEVCFQVACEELTLNDKPIKKMQLAGRYRGGELLMEQAEVAADGGDVSVWGKLGLRSGELALGWRVSQLDLLVVQTIAYSAAWRLDRAGRVVPHRELYALVPRPLEGRLNGEGTVTGTIERPELTADFLVTSASFAGRPVEMINGHVSASRGRTEVSVEGLHQTARASLKGFVEPGGEVSLSADIRNLDLGLLEPWLQWGVRLGGEGTVNFDITGTTAHPVLMGDVRVDNLWVGPLHCEAAEAVPIRLDSRGTLTIEGIRLRDRDLQGYGEASVPVRLPGARSSAITQGARAELHLRQASLTPVPGMTPVLYDADLFLTGDRVTLGSPEADGEERYGVRAALGSGKLLMEGEVQVRGLAPSQWDSNRFNVGAELQAAEVEISGVGRGSLDGRLELTNRADTGRPTLRTPPGQPIVLSQAELSLSGVGRRQQWSLALPFSPELQVRVATGQQVWLRHGSSSRPTAVEVDPATEAGVVADEEASGYLDIGGTLSATGVTLDGRVTSHHGVLAFPNGVLTLRQGEARLQREPGDRLPRVSVRAEADGRIGDYHVYLNPEGQVYPPAATEEATDRLVSAPFRWNARSLPHLEEGYVLALLGGPVAAPTGGGSQDLAALLRGPGAGSAPGELTGIMLPSLGGALGVHEFSVDLALRKPVRLRIGEKLFSRVTISYISALGDLVGSRSVRVNWEVRPRLALGWSVDESERTLWEIQSFVPF